MTTVATTEAITLVRALKEFFEIEGSKMVAEFKQLSEEDKIDFIGMFSDIGIPVKRAQ